MRTHRLLPIALAAGCVYFNAMYDANREYDAALKSLREQSDVQARVQFDSVIAKTGRIVEDHPGSKYADDAAILKARAELHTRVWESAVETSTRAEQLAGSPKSRAVAMGLRGVALQELGDYGAADSLLSLALAADLNADDEALFLFQRGLAGQGLGRSDEAAADLEAAASSVELSPEGSLTLAVALRDIGQYERSAGLTGRILRSANPNPQSPEYLHADSLATLAPTIVDSLTTALLAEPAAPATRRAGYHYLRGRALLAQGRIPDALLSFDEAVAAAASSQAAGQAAYCAIELRLRAAARPSDITDQLDRFPIARRSATAESRKQAGRWERAAGDFEGLMEAYASRGASAAEAMLRAAEIARVELGSLAVARGGYLLYLDLVPGSRWAAKAIYGALSVSGHPPDPSWVTDRGASTDEELRRRWASLPPDDPYALALGGAPTDLRADSMYVLAEADLRRRLVEIQMLFDPTATDTVPEEDEVPLEGDGEEVPD